MFRGILAALGLINFGFGILAAIEPQLVAGWIGFELTGPGAFGEMRAVFGGAVAVVGILFIVAMLVPRPAALLGGLALVFAALSLGRIASLMIDGLELLHGAGAGARGRHSRYRRLPLAEPSASRTGA